MSLILLLVSFAIADWQMGGLDYTNNRNQKDSSLTKCNIKFLTQKWFHQNPIYVLNQPTIIDDYVYFGDFNSTNNFMAVNASTGLDIWRVTLAGPVAGGALVDEDELYVCTIGGLCYNLNRYTGSIKWVKVLSNPVWVSPLKIKNILYVSANPGEDTIDESYMRTKCCVKRGSFVLLNVSNGALINETPLIPEATFINVTVALPNVYDGLGKNTTFPYGPSGAAAWGDMAYSEKFELIYMCNGQANSPNASGLAPRGVDSCFAFNLRGEIVWQTSVRELRNNDINDIYNSAMFFDPMHPTDMDVGNGPMLYKTKVNGKKTWVIGTGDKQGNWYVFDAKTGKVINGDGYETLLPGPPRAAANGGFNLQSAGGKVKGVWKSFGNLLSTYSSQICDTTGGPVSQCLKFDRAGNFSAHIVAMSGDGKTELDRFTKNNTLFLGGIVLSNNMVFVRDAVFKKLLVLDAENLNNILLEYDLSAHLSGGDLGAHMAISDDTVYIGTGIYGSPTHNGLIALSLPA